MNLVAGMTGDGGMTPALNADVGFAMEVEQRLRERGRKDCYF